MLVIGVVLKAQVVSFRKDMLFLLAGFILASLSGVAVLMASAFDLIVSPTVVMPLIMSILTMGFLFIAHSFSVKA
ncbi:MAG: hypothetical protein ACOC5L_00605 [Halobacteriota archaeon]